MTPPSVEALQLAPTLYDVALSSNHWEEAVDRMAYHLRAKGAAVFYQDVQHPELDAEVSCYSAYWRSDFGDQYLQEVADDEPSARLMRSAPPQSIVTSESIPIEIRQQIVGYAEKMEALFGISAVAAARLNDEAHWFDYITFQYASEHGPMQEAERNDLAFLLPHVAKAMEIARPMALLEQRFSAVLEALDHLHLGVFILSRNKSLVIANNEAYRVIDDSDGLALSELKRLCALRTRDDDRLQRALDNVTTVGSSGKAKTTTLLNIPRRSGRDDYLLELVPLRDRSGIISRELQGVLVICIDPAYTAHVSTKGIREIYGLTRSEAALCRLLIDGMSNTEMADARKVSPETIKSQLKSALQKTRCNNRATLVKRVLSLNLPVDQPEERRT